MKFEYHCKAMPSGWMDREKVLNQAGQDGWDLIGVDTTVAYFKREIPEPKVVKTKKTKDSTLDIPGDGSIPNADILP